MRGTTVNIRSRKWAITEREREGERQTDRQKDRETNREGKE